MKDTWKCWLLLSIVGVLNGLPVAAEDIVSFNRDVRAILSDRCFECHGPGADARQAELRLDTADGPEGPFADRDGEPIIRPGDPDGSALWQRLIADDESLRMPPADAHKPPLNDQELQTIRQWIVQGAEYQNFWAFVPPEAPVLPEIGDPRWQAPIDRFIRARQLQEQLTAQPRADRRTLIRRLTFDLTGLPPTREEIHQFLNDDSPEAWPAQVDRLLNSPAYGEHMARYWLDLVRFADTNGIHHDHYREMTPYRDWVIRAFNENLAFDEFVIWQLAGDLYDQPTTDQLVASGFNRLHLVIDRGTALPEESYTRNVVDRVSAFGTAFLGLTLECAVCHDHKYDPITQRDFYQLFAFFNNIDTEPETPGKNVHPPFLRLPTPEQQQQLSDLEKEIAAVSERIERLEKTSPETTPSAGEESVGAGLPQHRQKLKQLTQDRDRLNGEIRVTLISRERPDVRPAYILTRGAYDQPGEQVDRGTPSFLPAMAAGDRLTTRMDLAQWVTDAGNPLLARVAVNRFWQQFFGSGLVRTSEDFGAQGEYPSHPQLLDHLAVQFVQSGWNVKALVRSIVLSETWMQSSQAPASAWQVDPENRLLARGSRYRLDSEMIRDQMLAVSGLLNRTMYGKSVKPPQPPNLWKSVSMVSSSTYAFEADTGDSIHRRSLYSFWKRAMPPPQMTIFDAPTRERCIARRERTNTPLQALVLMNESQYFLAARTTAENLLAKVDLDDRQRLQESYETLTAALPDAAVMSSLERGLEALRSAYRDDVALAQEMTADVQNINDEQRVELAAWTMLMNSLFNLDQVKTRE